jgi:hypothetical protein
MRLTALAFAFPVTLTLAGFVVAFFPSAVPGVGGHDAISVVKHIFEMADKDGSGTLTRAEYREAKLQRYGVSFDDCDADADGETSLAEYLDLYERLHPADDSISL